MTVSLQTVKKSSIFRIMSEIIFEVIEDEIDGGYSASALGMASIPTVRASKSFAKTLKKRLNATLMKR